MDCAHFWAFIIEVGSPCFVTEDTICLANICTVKDKHLSYTNNKQSIEMAYPLSPSGHPGHPSNRPNSPPAPAAPPSKRDKRRNALAEKYHDLTDTFTNSRDYQFRTTVHELQGEMALIAGADVGSSNLTADDEKKKESDGGLALAPLGDTPADINARIQAMVKAGQIAGDGGLPSGRWYAGFVQEVNREREEREAGLVELMVSRLNYVLCGDAD